MSESLESFVNKLQEEGVNAGKEAAEAIRREAEEEGERILADARREAERIVAEARARGKDVLSRAQAEMELAVRDALLKLCETLSVVLSTLLVERTEKELSNPDRLGEIIREVIIAYAKADAAREHAFRINLAEETGRKTDLHSTLESLLGDLGAALPKIEVQAMFQKAGFEYRIHGGTVEVTTESVAEVLFDMLSPGLQEVVEKIMTLKIETP